MLKILLWIDSVHHDIFLSAFDHVMGKHRIEIWNGGGQNYAMSAKRHIIHLDE